MCREASAKVEPDSEQYRKSEAALAQYLELEKLQEQTGVEPLPMAEKALSVGGSYPAAAELWARLQLEGDAPPPAEPRPTVLPAPPPTYSQEESDAVKRYQERHGFDVNGRLTPQTVKSLNVPMSERVLQLQFTRWSDGGGCSSIRI